MRSQETHFNIPESRYLRSGQFAALCRTTKETLRHYRAIGLIEPAFVSDSGYAYYSPLQLGDFMLVAALQRAGSSLADIRRYLEWMRAQVAKNDLIEVRLDTEATPERIRELHPDAVVIAVGAEPRIPDFPGQELNNVIWFGDVDTGAVPVGDHVVLIGGGPSGAETALQLARDGKTVTLVDRNPEQVVKGRWIKCLDAELADNGVAFRFQSHLARVTERGAVIADQRWREEEIPADTIILSLGFASDQKAVEALTGLAPDTYVIGDCKKVNSVMQAVHDGFNVASIL